MSEDEIKQCVVIMKKRGGGDTPHPFFA